MTGPADRKPQLSLRYLGRICMPSFPFTNWPDRLSIVRQVKRFYLLLETWRGNISCNQGEFSVLSNYAR